MNYCIGDVHGCYDEMISLVDTIEQQDEDARFIFLGDFVDRGPKVWETLQWVMNNITPDGKYRSVQGNHEQMVVQWYVRFCEWYNSGIRKLFTEPPKPNYDFMEVAKANDILNPEALKPVIDFFVMLPFHIAMDVTTAGGREVTYDIVHAWYNYEEEEDSAQQYLDNLWAREVNGNMLSDHIVVHGHTPTLSAYYLGVPHSTPGRIVYRKNAINLDGGCVYSGMVNGMPGYLCGICLETLEEFYSPVPDSQTPVDVYRKALLRRIVG